MSVVEQAGIAASMVSMEQAYFVLEALLTGAGDDGSQTRSVMALRAALHPALRPALADPLTTVGGAYVSLDARLPFIAAPILARAGARTLAQFSDADWATLALVGIAPPNSLSLPEDSRGMSCVGAIAGTLFVPAQGAAILCGVRAWVGTVSGEAWERERLGWEPPRAIRSVSPSIAASAEQALRAALLLLCADDALPTDLRPGPVFYDICAPLSDEQTAGIDGDSLELPLALAFLSALTRRPLSGALGATGAIGIDREGHISVEPVGAAPAKASAFFASLGEEAAPCFLVPANGGETAEALRATPVAAFRDAVRMAFPEGLSDRREAPFVPSGSDALPVLLHACIVSDTLRSAPALRAPLARLLREILDKAGGEPAGALHDAAPNRLTDAARFARVDAAAVAATRLLRTLRCYPWAQRLDDTLLPGIGIDVGDGGADGGSPDRAAAIAESAASGRILLSAAIRASYAQALPEALLTPLGTHRLCDLLPPLALSEWMGKSAPPSVISNLSLRQRLDDRPHNLPIVAAPLFGRAQAVANLETLLRASADSASADSARRTITLTGVGGVGKSRLALHVAAGVAGNFDEGVWLVPVGAANAAEEVAVAVAETLRLDLPGGTTEVARAVGESLAGQRVLLVLDGSEESATNGAIVAFLATLHAAAPGVVCLVTARGALGMTGEITYPVLPLDVPDANAEDDAAIDAAPTASVALFCDCARRAHPGFALSRDSDLHLVAAITRRLAGLPLAIELAAAPVGALTLTEIEHRLSVATVAGETSRPANRAWTVLRQTIEWANALLDPADQAVLADLSVFADGFTATDAATVCAEDGDREAVAESLLLLEQRSLVRRPVGGDRFFLLQMVQDFARRRLEQSGRLTAAQTRHALCFADRAARDGATRDSEREAEAFDRLDAEMGNLRAAVDFLRVADPGALPALVDHLWMFLRQRGHPREWRVWPRLALRLLAPSNPDYARLSARLMLFRGASALDASEVEEASVLLQTACDRARAQHDERTLATALNLLGLAQSRRKYWNNAQSSHEEARDIFRRVGDRQGEIAALNNLALLSSRRGEKKSATEYYQSVVDLCRAIDDRRGLALAVGNLGVLALDAGNPALARPYCEESLRESRKLRDTRQTTFAMMNLGEAVHQSGDEEQGVLLLAVAEALLRHLRHAPGSVEVQRILAGTEPGYGIARLATLRAELARHSLPALLQIDPSRHAPRTLRLESA